MRYTPNAVFPVLRLALLALLLQLAASGIARAQDLMLYMVEQPGCIYCARWNAEVGDAYHLTTEGKAAPLARVDLRAPLPDGVIFARKAVFTPTFVLARAGKELDRIEGYPGEDFFYGLLGVMLKNADLAME